MKNDLPEGIAGNQPAAQVEELQTCVDSLQGLIRDLLIKNQELRMALSAERSRAKNGERLVPASEDGVIQPQPSVDLEVREIQHYEPDASLWLTTKSPLQEL
jgi:hypothetical protein